MKIRRYQSTDLSEITELFYNTVHTVNAQHYSQEQLNAWANGKIDYDKWNNSLLSHYTLVATDNNGKIIGFGDITEDGYLDKLYIHHEHIRKGIATALCDALEQHRANKSLTTHASITAKNFFMNRGYKVTKEQQVMRNGIKLTNFVMKKTR